MIGLVIFIAVAIAAAFKTPRGPLYWLFCISAVAYLFVVGPLLFQFGGTHGNGLVTEFILQIGNEPLWRAWSFVSSLLIYGGAIGLLLLAIRDGRGTIRSPRSLEES